jgi:hypothetical protein
MLFSEALVRRDSNFTACLITVTGRVLGTEYTLKLETIECKMRVEDSVVVRECHIREFVQRIVWQLHL